MSKKALALLVAACIVMTICCFGVTMAMEISSTGEISAEGEIEAEVYNASEPSDAVIDNVTLDFPVITEGDSFRVTADVENADSATVKVYNDSKVLVDEIEKSASELSSGVSFTTTTGDAGEYSVLVASEGSSDSASLKVLANQTYEITLDALSATYRVGSKITVKGTTTLPYLILSVETSDMSHTKVFYGAYSKAEYEAGIEFDAPAIGNYALLVGTNHVNKTASFAVAEVPAINSVNLDYPVVKAGKDAVIKADIENLASANLKVYKGTTIVFEGAKTASELSGGVTLTAPTTTGIYTVEVTSDALKAETSLYVIADKAYTLSLTALKNSYYANKSFKVTGSTTIPYLVLTVTNGSEVVREVITESQFESGYSVKTGSVGNYSLTLGIEDTEKSAEYEVIAAPVSTGSVTVRIEGYNSTFVDTKKVPVSGNESVLEIAEKALGERKYKTEDGSITAIATTATGSTYFANGKYEDEAKWSYFINGVADDEAMDSKIVEGGSELIIYYGIPFETPYALITIDPEEPEIKDTMYITVEAQLTAPDGSVTREPMKGVKVAAISNDDTTRKSATTDADGEAKITAPTTACKENIVVTYYVSSKLPKIVRNCQEVVYPRTGSAAAYVTIEGSEKTWVPRYSVSTTETTALDYITLALGKKNIVFEENADNTGFYSIGTGTKMDYQDRYGNNDDWYLVINDEVLGLLSENGNTPIYKGDKILLYFGDAATIYPLYTLNPETKIYTSSTKLKMTLTYVDPESGETEKLADTDVEFEYNDKTYSTTNAGVVTFPTVSKKGTYDATITGYVSKSSPVVVKRVIEITYTAQATTSGGGSGSSSNSNSNSNSNNGGSVIIPDNGGTVIIPDNGNTNNNNGNGTPSSSLYKDTNIDSWAVSYVEKANQYGLMTGTGTGYFEPLRGITRAEFTTMVVRLLGLDTEGAYSQVFMDVSPSDWHYKYIMTAYQYNLVAGKTPMGFAPDDYLTREEMAVLLARVAGLDPSSDAVGYADKLDVSIWAIDYVSAVSKKGLMVGDQFNQFLPKETVNRQTAATVAVRLYEL